MVLGLRPFLIWVVLKGGVHIAGVPGGRQARAGLRAPALGISPAAALASPHAVAGTVDEIVEDLRARRERWDLSYIGISEDAVDALAPVVARLAGT